MARIRKNARNSAAKEPPFWLVGIYIRLSREDGGDESLSIVNQRKIILEYISENFDDRHAVIDDYVDDGVTGTDFERPEFQRLLKDIEAKRVNCVLCKTLSRAFRNYADQGFFLESFFPKHGIRFISIAGPSVDSFMNPEALVGLEVPITGLMNDRYAGKTSEDVRRTFDTKRRKGEFIGAFAPYGYRKDDGNKNKLILDPEAADVVRDIFGLYVGSGSSIQGIVRALNNRGIPNPSAFKKKRGLAYQNPNALESDDLWNATTIRRMLQNEMYLGHMVQGRQRTISYKVHDRVSVPRAEWFIHENTHEAIVSPELFDRTQEMLSRDIRSANGTSKPGLLSGFIRCADCGKALCRHPAKGIVYYHCRTYSQKARGKCTKHSIRGDALEETLLAVFRSQVSIAELCLKAFSEPEAQKDTRTRDKRLEALLRGKTQEYEKLRKAYACLYVDLKNQALSRDEYLEFKKTLDPEMERLRLTIAGLEAECAEKKGHEPAETSPATRILESGAIEQLDRGLLAVLLERVSVHEEKRVVITCKHSDPFLQPL